jgi:hypothetical protein
MKIIPGDIKKSLKRTYVYLGDEKGNLKIWDITNLIKGLGINKVENDMS